MKTPSPSIATVEAQHAAVERLLLNKAAGSHINILEAGCGRQWYYQLEQGTYTLTGVDLDGHALEARKTEKRDLHRVIVGDLRTIQLPAAGYDIIYNSYVLEHIKGARQVLDNFLTWLKPGGILVLYIPDPDSAYGLLSKLTPHWIHVMFYRYVLGRPNAGKPGNAPYPTHYDDVVSRQGIHAYARSHHLRILQEYGYYKPGGLANVAIKIVSLLSFGRLASSHCDLLYILEKPRIAAETPGPETANDWPGAGALQPRNRY